MDAATRVVAVGGGHGLAQVLAALRRLDLAPTAVVTVADDGGSSGRLRRDLGIIAPGDLRMSLLALARDDALAEALSHRFSRGHLEGHALGNLLLVGLAEQADGDWVAALRRAGELLDCCGEVLPSTLEPVQLKAEVAGREIEGQASVTNARGHIERVWLEPGHPPACTEAVAAIHAADAIVLAPGSLFTSLIVNLLVPDVARAVAEARAPLLHVANLRTQPGETAGLDLHGHVEALLGHLGGRGIDTVVVHDGPPVPGPGRPLGAHLEHPEVHRLVRADLVTRHGTAPGHDVERLAGVLGGSIGP